MLSIELTLRVGMTLFKKFAFNNMNLCVLYYIQKGVPWTGCGSDRCMFHKTMKFQWHYSEFVVSTEGEQSQSHKFLFGRWVQTKQNRSNVTLIIFHHLLHIIYIRLLHSFSLYELHTQFSFHLVELYCSICLFLFLFVFS